MARCVDAELLAVTYMEAAKEAGAEELAFLTPGDVARTILKCADSCEEIAPVVHAYWTDDGECSNCGGYQLFEKAADRYMYWRSTSTFCPLCGAIMDEEAD